MSRTASPHDASEETPVRSAESVRAAMGPKGPIPDPAPGPLDPAVRHQVRLAVGAALSRKAEDISVIDVRGRTSYCDVFVLATGAQARQVRAIADALVHDVKAERGTPPAAEGTEAGRWVLVDLGDVLLHVFDGPMRGYYDLDGLWTDAPRMSFASLGFDEEGRDLEADEAASS